MNRNTDEVNFFIACCIENKTMASQIIDNINCIFADDSSDENEADFEGFDREDIGDNIYGFDSDSEPDMAVDSDAHASESDIACTSDEQSSDSEADERNPKIIFVIAWCVWICRIQRVESQVMQ